MKHQMNNSAMKMPALKPMAKLPKMAMTSSLPKLAKAMPPARFKVGK